MLGVITGREVLRKGWTIIREFGPATYGRCVLALATGRPTTFLAVISRATRRRHAHGMVALSPVAVTASAGLALTVDGFDRRGVASGT
jgi:hypothetical protein